MTTRLTGQSRLTIQHKAWERDYALPGHSPTGDNGFGDACPHAVPPRTKRTIQINKHAPMNPAIR